MSWITIPRGEYYTEHVALSSSRSNSLSISSEYPSCELSWYKITTKHYGLSDVLVIFGINREFRKPQRQRKRRQSKGLMNKTMHGCAHALWFCRPLKKLTWQSRSQSLRSPLPAVGKRELGEQPFQACMHHRCRLRSETGWAEFGYFLCFFLLLPELSFFPTAGQGERRLLTWLKWPRLLAICFSFDI